MSDKDELFETMCMLFNRLQEKKHHFHKIQNCRNSFILMSISAIEIVGVSNFDLSFNAAKRWNSLGKWRSSL